MFKAAVFILFCAIAAFSCRPACADTATAFSEVYTDSGSPDWGEPVQSGLHGTLGAGWFKGKRIVGDPRRRTVLLPVVVLTYEDWAYWSLTGGGVWLYRSDEWPLTLGAGVKVHPGYSPGNDPDLIGMEKRKSSVDSYANALWKTELVNIGATYYHDIGNVTHGDAATIRFSHHIRVNPKLTVTPRIGAEFEDARLVGYYYGVTPEEVLPERPLYIGHHAISYSGGAAAVYRLNRSWALMGAFFATHLGNGIGDSPIVLQRHTTAGFFGAGRSF